MRHRVRTASPIISELFTIANSQGLTVLDYAKASRKHPNQMSGYRSGRNEPGIITVEEMALALGYKLSLAPLDEPDK